MDDMQNRQTVLFSATQTPEVGKSVIQFIYSNFSFMISVSFSSYALMYLAG
jgi:superfamily II DNA/RNA helicase